MPMIQLERNPVNLPPRMPIINCTHPTPVQTPAPTPSRPISWFGTHAVLALMLFGITGLVLLAAVAHKIFGKGRPDSTATDTAGLETAQHPLLTKDTATNYSYLIEHSAIKLEPNSVIGSGAEGFVMRGKFNGAQVAVKIVTLGMNEHQRQSVVTEATQEVKLLQPVWC